MSELGIGESGFGHIGSTSINPKVSHPVPPPPPSPSNFFCLDKCHPYTNMKFKIHLTIEVTEAVFNTEWVSWNISLTPLQPNVTAPQHACKHFYGIQHSSTFHCHQPSLIPEFGSHTPFCSRSHYKRERFC